MKSFLIDLGYLIIGICVPLFVITALALVIKWSGVTNLSPTVATIMGILLALALIGSYIYFGARGWQTDWLSPWGKALCIGLILFIQILNFLAFYWAGKGCWEIAHPSSDGRGG